MDHLVRPINDALPYPRISLICDDVEHCDDFLAFRHVFANKWNVIAPTEGSGTTIWLSDAAHRFGIATVEAFVQRWIFFGLLHEILGPLGLYDASDYVEAEGSSKFVHTRHLRSTTRTWSENIAKWDIEKQGNLGDRMFECLDIAILSLADLYENPLHHGYTVNQDIKISLLAILDAVSGLADVRLQVSTYEDKVFPARNFWVLYGERRTQMIENGWCPSEIDSLQATIRSVTGQLFASRVRRALDGLDHTDCTEIECKKLQIIGLEQDATSSNKENEESTMAITSSDQNGTSITQRGSYVPAHVDSACQCDELGPDQVAVLRCLDSDTFPLLRITHDESHGTAMEVVPFREGAAYVAISHVWVDGLGNPESTSLPACQARRLQGLLAGLRGLTFQHGQGSERRTEDRDLLLWCDTYCCPTTKENPRGQQLALSKMKEVYGKASYVLVLDNELSSLSYSSLSPIERLARLIISRWMKRLWTFQESALAPKLLINFSKQPVDLVDIWSDIGAHLRLNPLDQLLARFFLSTAHQMYAWHSTYTSSAQPMNHILRLANAVHGRGVSKSTDEPLCLAAVLDLDLGAVARAKPEERMEVFWRLAAESEGGVPPGIVFQAMPRLRGEEGYGWAPASLIGKKGEGLGGPLVMDSRDMTRGILTEIGMRIRRPGWRIGMKKPVLGTGPKDLAGRTPVVKTRHGKWYNLGVLRNLDGDVERNVLEWLRDEGKEWYVIIDYEPGTEEFWRGLLAYKQGEGEKEVYRSVGVMSNVEISRLWGVLLQISSDQADVVAQHDATRKMQKLSLDEDSLALDEAKTEFERLLDERVQEAKRTPHGDEVAKYLFDPRNPPAWKTFIHRWLTEYVVTIVEEFSSDHEWHVS